QRDVDVPVGVFQQLGGLRLAAALSGCDGVDESTVEVSSTLRALGCYAADDLGRVLDAVGGVAWVDPLGGEREIEVGASCQAPFFQQRLDDLLGGSRPGGGLKDHHLPWLKLTGDGLDRAGHGAQVRRSVCCERGGDADDDGLR